MSSATQPGVHSAGDAFCPERRRLDAIFRPRSIAVIGATAREGSVGRSILDNLRKSPFPGSLYPVNPTHSEILGLRCYPTVASLPAPVDLAIVITPALTVPGVIGECVRAGIGGAVVISAGFKERGAAGAKLEQEIRQRLRGSTMRLIGPNCLGVMNPSAGINATFAHDMALPGSVAFLSQSGALETAILDWSLQQRVGFSLAVSTGSMLDVGWAELIDYCGADDHTRSILLYLESVGDARAFLSAARAVAPRKPVILIKAGRSEAASRAAASHTGALTGRDEVFDAAVSRCGVLRVQSISDLFHLSEVLDRQPRPRGPRLAIVTNAGGPGVLATDALIAYGGELAPLSNASVHALNGFLPPHWSHGNPIDVLGDAGVENYGRAFEIALHDPGSDGVLAIVTPQGMTDPAGIAERLKALAQNTDKPVLASWMGGHLVAAGTEILHEAGISSFAYPDTAARAFCYLARYSALLHGLDETPSPAEEAEAEDGSRDAVSRLIESARSSGRTLLTEAESKAILAQYGIATVETRLARSEDQAAALARLVGFPAVVKLHSNTITHKTEVGGVKLSLADQAAVHRAYREIEASVRQKAGAAAFQGVTVQPMAPADGYELILGSSVDPQFGPVILFGSGGQLVEVYRDHALALPPLNATLARQLIEHTRIAKALQGIRGRAPVDWQALTQTLVRFSRLILEQAWIKEIDINPLLSSPQGALALDARIVLHAPDTAPEALPKAGLSPLPGRGAGAGTLPAGTSAPRRPAGSNDFLRGGRS